MDARFFCYARGRGNSWEAHCVDLDIAVEGASFDEVHSLLAHAINTYLEDVAKEDSVTQRDLMRRKAPMSVRLRYALGFLLHVLRNRRSDRTLQANFDLACRA